MLYGMESKCKGIFIAETCPELGLENGVIIAIDFEIGSRIEFRCNDGYQLIGRELITCTSNLDYDFDAPTCEGLEKNLGFIFRKFGQPPVLQM